MSDELKDTLDAAKKEVKGAISSRFNSPFIGALIVSWLAWNHRLIFVLFSEMAVDQRFHYIDEKLYPTSWAFLLFNVLGPLGSALVYIFLMPWPTEWVHKWNLGRERRLRESERKSAGEELLGRDESIAFRMDRQQRIKQLGNARSELEHSKRALVGWRALAEARADLVAASGAISDYLKSQEFRVADPRIPHIGPIARFRFEDEGKVFVIGKQIAPAAESWVVKDGALRICDGEGVELVVFEYQLATGVFMGTSSGKQWELTGEFRF